MKNTLGMLSALVVVILNTCLAEDSSKMTPDDHYIDYKLFCSIASNTVASLEFVSKSDGAVDKMLSEGRDKVTASFIAAQISWLQGKSSKAIGILENLIRIHGNSGNREKGGLPVAVAANFWIGTIYRHYGDAERAKLAYAQIADTLSNNDALIGLRVFCYLYLGEIESVMLGKQSDAVKVFQGIGKMKQPHSEDENMTKGWNMLRDWAEFQILCLTTGKEKARMTLKGSSYKLAACSMLADGLLRVDGIMGQPRADFYDGGNQAMLTASLSRAIECRTSPIDRSLSQLLIAEHYEHVPELVKAEEYYRALFDGDSFFAPEGGIFLAGCQKKQGKSEEAKNTFSKVKERFPGYSKLIDDLSGK